MSAERSPRDTAREAPRDSRSLLQLLRDLPSLLVALAKAEFTRAKDELVAKLKHAGIGIAFFVVAAVFGWLALNVLIVTAILGIATALPAWLSALIVGVVLLVVAGILALLGIRALKGGVPPTPKETMASVHEDVEAIKGIGQYGK